MSQIHGCYVYSESLIVKLLEEILHVCKVN